MRGRGGFGAHLEELLLHLVDGLLLLALDDAAIWEHRSAAARPGPAPRPRRRETSTGCGGHRGASALRRRRRRRVSGEAQRPGGGQGEPRDRGHGGQGSWGHAGAQREEGARQPQGGGATALALPAVCEEMECRAGRVGAGGSDRPWAKSVGAGTVACAALPDRPRAGGNDAVMAA